MDKTNNGRKRSRSRGRKRSRQVWAIHVSDVPPTTKLMNDLERFFIRRVCKAEKTLLSKRIVRPKKLRSSSGAPQKKGSLYFEFRNQSQQEAALKLDGTRIGKATLRIEPWIKESAERNNEQETHMEDSQPPSSRGIRNNIQSTSSHTLPQEEKDEPENKLEKKISVDDNINAPSSDINLSVHQLKAKERRKRSRQVWAIQVSNIPPTIKLMNELERFFIKRVCDWEKKLLSMKIVDNSEHDSSSPGPSLERGRLLFFEFRNQPQQQAALELDGTQVGGCRLRIRPWIKESVENNREQGTHVEDPQPSSSHGISKTIQSASVTIEPHTLPQLENDEPEKKLEPKNSVDDDMSISSSSGDNNLSLRRLETELEAKERLLAAANEHIKVLTETNSKYEKRIVDQVDQIEALKARLHSQQVEMEKLNTRQEDEQAATALNHQKDLMIRILNHNIEMADERLAKIQKDKIEEDELLEIQGKKRDDEIKILQSELETIQNDKSTIVWREKLWKVQCKKKDDEIKTLATQIAGMKQDDVTKDAETAKRIKDLEAELKNQQLDNAVKEGKIAKLETSLSKIGKEFAANKHRQLAKIANQRRQLASFQAKLKNRNLRAATPYTQRQNEQPPQVPESRLENVSTTGSTRRAEGCGDKRIPSEKDTPTLSTNHEALNKVDLMDNKIVLKEEVKVPPQKNVEELEAKLVKALQDQNKLLEENRHLRRDKQSMQQTISTMEVHAEEIEQLREENEQLLEEVEQMRMNQAMEMGFASGESEPTEANIL